MKRYLFSLAAVLCLSSGAGITAIPGGSCILENRFFRVTVSPESGGRIISFKSKATGKEYTSPASDLGIAGLANWQDGSVKRSQWFGTQYRAEVIKDKQKSTLRLERLGSQGMMDWVTAGISYEVRENSSTLHIKYSIAVNQNAMSSVPFCIWMHNSIQVKNEKAEMTLPAPEGIRKIGLDMTVPENESFHYDAADGWFTFKSRKSDEGLAFSAPWEKLMCFYNWQGADANTMEMMFYSHTIPHGGKFELPVDITLFDLKTAPEGAGNGFAGSFRREKNKITGVEIYAASSQTVMVEFRKRILPGSLGIPIAGHKAVCTAGKSIKLDLDVTEPASGIEEIICRVRSSSGKTLMTMRAPNAREGKTADYKRPAAGRKDADTNERFGKRLAASLAMKDCYKWNFDLPLAGGSRPWLKPYTGGKLKLLILTDMISGREAIELAGRMDAEAETCTFSGMGWLDWHPLWAGRDGATESNIFLGNLLKKNWDAILIAGIQIDKIAKENRDIIAGMVRNGTGLVSIMPTSIPETAAALFPASPVIRKPVYQRHEPLLANAEKISAAGTFPGAFPFNSLLPVTVFPYKSKSAVLTADGKPFYCTGSFGAGKTALFTWLVGRPDNTRRGGIMPFLKNAPSFAVQDYYYGMIIKALLWSAGREPDIAIKDLKCSGQQVRLTIDNRTNSAITSEIELSTRPVSGAPVCHTGKFTRTLAAGKNRITLPLPGKEFPHGTNLLDVRLKTGDLAADFAAAAFEVKNSAYIENAEVRDKVYRENEQITILVTSAGKSSGAKISAELTDRHGRKTAAEYDIPVSAGGKNTIKLIPRGLYSRIGEVILKLHTGGTLLDYRKIKLDFLPPAFENRDWNDYRVVLSWPLRANRVLPFHLRPLWENTLKELGVNTITGYAIPVGWGHDEDENMLICRGDFRFIAESIARISKRTKLPYCTNQVFDYRWRKKEFKQLMTSYNKTRDKKFLRRNPSLEDEKFITAYTTALRRYLPSLSKFHPAIYDLGDEMSYGLFSNPLDLDFSESSLREFRKWLKSRYASIDELNREWKKSYKSFDEATPDTAIEARERQVFASWGMHRLYNAKVFTDFLRLTVDTIRSADPGAKVTMSGTQEPKPYNGYDWSELMKLFDSVTAYTINGMPEVMRSFRKIPTSGWSGYGVSRRNVMRQIWNNAFNGHFGVALYNEMVMLNPDLTLTDHAKDLRDAFMPLKNGIGSLLFNSERKKPFFAIHYSQASAVASWIEQASGDFSDSRRNWVDLIKSLGANLKFVSSAEIEDDILTRENFKGFVMPSSFALSGKEREAVRNFINQGGAVFADIMPGKWTDRFVKTSDPVSQDIMITGKLPNDTTSAEMIGLRKKIKGKLAKYLTEENSSELKLSHNTEMHQFELGKNGGKIFAFWNTGAGTVSTAIPHGYHLYDVLNKTVISKKRFSVAPGTPGVYVMMPYRIDAVCATAEKKDRKISLDIRIAAGTPRLTRHVFLVEIFRDGRKFEPYSAVMEAAEGHAIHRFHTGINEKSKLSFRITDVVSGKQTKGEL